MEWAKDKGRLPQAEILGFVDGKTSLDWINSAGGKVLNLLRKGSYRHVTQQLRKTPEQHIEDIKGRLIMPMNWAFRVNVYLEDWSNGMRNSKDYVHFYAG